MPTHGVKSAAATPDQTEKERDVAEVAEDRRLSDARKAHGEENRLNSLPASDTTCSNEQLSSLQTSIESGFTTMSSSITKAITDCFSNMADKFENNLLESDLEMSETEEPDEPASGKQKERETASIESLLDNRTKAAEDTTGKASNEDPKSMVLACIKQDLQADEVGDPIDTELSAIITSLLTKGMAEDKLQEKMTKIARPQNCEALTKVKVNQLIWDNLSANVRSQDLRMQKVQTSLIKGITGVVIATNKILSRLDSIPEGRDLTQGLSDGIAMLANANKEINMRRKEMIKPDLHDDYKHLCSSSLETTSLLFGDELSKQVKDLTEVNRVGKKVAHSRSARANTFGYKSRPTFGHGRGARYQSSRGPHFLGSRPSGQAGGTFHGKRYHKSVRGKQTQQS